MNAQSTFVLIAALGLGACSAEFPEPTDQTARETPAPTPDRDVVAPPPKDALVVDALPADMCAPNEICDGLDNDCDGQIDEHFDVGEACSVGQGACQRMGEWQCDESGRSACSVAAGAPTDEVCDGLDNDCDGTVDNVAQLGEACERVDALDPTCSTEGVYVCDPAADPPFSCSAPDPDPDGDGVGCAADCAPLDPTVRPGQRELCNLIDDDCDGQVDEETLTDCDCVEVHSQTHRYLACLNDYTWQNGVDRCRQYRSEAVVFENADEEFWLLATLAVELGAVEAWWLGMRQNEAGEYRWIDGQVPYDGWSVGEPEIFGRLPCVATAGLSRTWLDQDCGTRYGVICEDVCEAGDADRDGDGFSRCAGDCDDTESQVHPNAPEQCGNDRDDNCNGEIDDGCN